MYFAHVFAEYIFFGTYTIELQNPVEKQKQGTESWKKTDFNEKRG